jgi:hypothetical protein
MAEVFMFTEEPRGNRDKGAVQRKDTDKDWIGQITDRRSFVDFVDILVPFLKGTMRRR